jgi:hypothetical protein
MIMKKVFLFFVLACHVVVASAQISQTPVKMFDYVSPIQVFNYENGNQFFLTLEEDHDNDVSNIYFYDLAFGLQKTVTFSSTTIPGYLYLAVLIGNNNLKNSATMSFYGLEGVMATEKIFNDDDLLEFIVKTDGGFAIVNENNNEIFRKKYTDGWYAGELFSLLETKNGNLLVVHLYKRIPGEYYDEWAEKTEIYALPGYTASNVRSAGIQQLGSPYPNPAKTYIHLPYSLPQGANEGTIRVFDTQGRTINTFRVDGRQAYVRLEIGSLPAGNYFYTIQTRGGKSESKQFIVKG